MTTISFAECSYAANITIDTIALDNQQPSKYQFPIYREGDFLAIQNLTVKNIGNCTLENPIFKINVTNSEKSLDAPFCIYRLYIPTNISPQQSYISARIESNVYIDSINKTETHCFIELDTLGRWEITVMPDPEIPNPTKPTSWNFRSNGVFLTSVGFRAYSNLELYLADSAKQSNELARTAIIISGFGIFAAILISLYTQREQFNFIEQRHTNKQYNLLRALAIELKRIQRDSKSFDELLYTNKKMDIKLNKKRALIIPQYPIKTLNSAFYVKNLDNEIKRKSTENLKNILITIFDKTWLVNDSLRKLRNRDTIWLEGLIHYRRIDKRFHERDKGHAKIDLDKSIEEALNVLKENFGID